jgi:ubiquinone/menaquinone biosynthesis C-methylase UbiE
MKQISYYDDSHYDYKKYWETRKYENQAEKIALKKLFRLIHPKNRIIDIGGGFGRLTPDYAPLFKACLLIEPSEKLLKEASKVCQKYPNVTLQKSFVEQLPVQNESFDVALMVRVAHHLSDLRAMIQEVKRVLKPGGFFILEFANKNHFKNRLEAIFHFNWRFFADHTPESLKTKRLSNPFFNYHPNQIKTLLLANNFQIIKCLSVSNFRQAWFKKLLPMKFLLWLENQRQGICFGPNLHLGPSIFVLAQKEK